MTSRVSKLVLAAVLAGSLPAAALAHDGDRVSGCEGRPVAVAPEPWHPAPPAPRDGWREQRRRERERAAIRAELARLDAERARFHAEHAYRPGQLRRYDRRYLERRGELERRLGELTRVAWR